MFDRHLLPMTVKPYRFLAQQLDKVGLTANQLTITGFAFGMLALPALALQWYGLSLILILMNRIVDGLDGSLARLQGSSDAGAFLDITLDFIFYSAVVLGFALADDSHVLPAATLIFAFVGTGSSFLAFSIFAERRQLTSLNYPNKGMYYLDGITEGSETIFVFILMCLFPQYFMQLAYGFAVLCFVTTGGRIWSAYHTLKY